MPIPPIGPSGYTYVTKNNSRNGSASSLDGPEAKPDRRARSTEMDGGCMLTSKWILTLLLAVGLTTSFAVIDVPLWSQEADQDEASEESTTTDDDGAEKDDAAEKKKKKARPKPFGDRSGGNGPGPGGQPHGGGNEEIDQLVDEISTNMKRIEELLDQKSTGAQTQGLQRDTVESIEDLIKAAEKMMQQGQGGGGSGSQQMPSQGQQDQKQGSQQQELSERERQEKERQEKQRQQQQQQQQKPQQENDSMKVPNKNTREGAMPENEMGNLRDRDGKGRWGRLPKRVIEQMYDNGRRKLPEKYRLVLEEYYRRLPRSNSQ